MLTNSSDDIVSNYDSGGDEEAVLNVAGQGDDGPPDTHPDLTELPDAAFPTYFHTSGGRLFHFHGSTYPLPVDTPEQQVRLALHRVCYFSHVLLYLFFCNPFGSLGFLPQRINVQHNVLKLLINNNYVGPVPEVLAFDPSRQKIAIDLCTGTGKWYLHIVQL